MRSTRNLSKIIIAGLLISLTALSWAVKSSGNRYHKTVLTRAKAPVAYDPKLLAKLNDLLKTLDLTRTCAYSGTISVGFIADSSQDIKALPVIFYRKGPVCYYRCGADEMINDGGLNLQISHTQKKILLSRQKEVDAPAVGNMADFVSGMSSEHFELSTSEKDELETITLKNDKHLTCREFDLTYNKKTNVVDRVFARLTDPQSPLDKQMDKTLEISFREWTDTPDSGRYPQSSQVVQITGQGFSLREKYRNYELINIIK